MGKKSKTRDCPALGRGISSAECGAGRHATIACPVHCPFNPFSPATYDGFLEMETKVDKLCLRALGDALGPEEMARMLQGPSDPVLRDTADDYTRINAAILPALHVTRDAAGHTVADRLLADPAVRLSNDERNLIAAKNRIRVALVEPQEMRADGLIRAIDLLEPEAGEVLLLDRATWARAVRFRPMLIWLYPLPHHGRLYGGGKPWPEWPGLDLDPTEGLAEIMRHAGGPGPEAPLAARREWLAQNFLAVLARLDAVSEARRYDMIAGLDVAQGWAEFDLTAAESARVLAHLESSPAVSVIEPDANEDLPGGFTEAWDWCEPDATRQPPGHAADLGPVVLGRVVRREHTWRVIAYSRARLTRLRELFLATIARPDLAATRGFQQDIAAQMAGARPPAHPELVPPRLRENPARLDISTSRLDAPPPADQPLAYNASWVDLAIPALAGRTPREAVLDPAGRLAVMRLLKPRLADADERRLRGQPPTDDPVAHVRALGLHELDTPLPPPRPCPPEWLEDEDEKDFLPLPALPPPATQPLTRAQVQARFDAVCAHYADNDDLLDAWDDACPDLGELTLGLLPDDVTEDEIHLVEVAMALGWAILAGHDTRPLALNHDILMRDWDAIWPLLAKAVVSDNKLDHILALAPAQTEVARLVLGDLAHRLAELGPDKPGSEVLPGAIAWLLTLLPAYTMALKRR